MPRKEQPSDPGNVSGDKISQMAVEGVTRLSGKQFSLPNAETLTQLALSKSAKTLPLCAYQQGLLICDL